MLGVGLLDLNRLPVREFDTWAPMLEKVQKQREREARETRRG